MQNIKHSIYKMYGEKKKKKNIQMVTHREKKFTTEKCKHCDQKFCHYTFRKYIINQCPFTFVKLEYKQTYKISGTIYQTREINFVLADL